ncbi:MAG: DUF393 domain-containing protein [Gemmatimonadaceae bacterium]
MTERDGERYTVIYDGRCGVCTRLAATLAKMDTRGVFETVPSQLAIVQGRFPWIPPNAYSESLQLVRMSDNMTWQGAAAMEEIVGRLRAGWIFSWIFAVPFARPVAERAYRWFAAHRNELGCGERCQRR